MENKNSGFGVASFGLSIFCAIAMFAVVVIAGVMESSPGGMDPEAGATMLVGLAIFFFLFLDGIAAILGIVGLLQKDRKKALAGIGLGISVLTILGIFGLMLIGFAVGG